MGSDLERSSSSQFNYVMFLVNWLTAVEMPVTKTGIKKVETHLHPIPRLHLRLQNGVGVAAFI